MTAQTPVETLADRLREAAALIREQGHARGAVKNSDGFCAMGAIYAVYDRSEILAANPAAWCGAYDTLACHLGSIGFPPSPPWWNDFAAIDGEDVAATMEKAAAAWEEAR